MRLTAKQNSALARLTPFQRSVLLECARIPRGQTRTYSQIAHAIGKPRAARAVGNALAINPLAPAIPCHRVVRGGRFLRGKKGRHRLVRQTMTAEWLGGYSAKGGVAKKKLLLEKERRG
ncbi:MAG: MGMT family protein [Candidatus Micrarchaeia archaeon]|jgi:O-6-methylguanine DNA methyltransferase